MGNDHSLLVDSLTVNMQLVAVGLIDLQEEFKRVGYSLNLLVLRYEIEEEAKRDGTHGAIVEGEL